MWISDAESERNVTLKQITIKIGTNGTIEAETHGMKGKECLKYLERIEQMANATTIDSEYTKEYYETDNILDNSADQVVKSNG